MQEHDKGASVIYHESGQGRIYFDPGCRKCKSTILDTLQDGDKFTKLQSGPREEIKLNLKQLLNSFYAYGLLTQDVRFAITGQIKKSEITQNHEFCIGTPVPYIYSLFKIYKLTEEQILEKTIPPTRMVTVKYSRFLFH